MKKHFALLVLSLALGVSIAKGDDVIFPARVAPTEESRTLIVVLPDAARVAAESAASEAIGQSAWVALSFNLGTVNGLRALFIPVHTEDFSIAIEGIYGLSVNTVASLRETFGGGVRASFTVASDGKNDAMLVSPGVDILFANGTPGHGLAEYSSYGHIFYVATSLDVSYVHQFARHFGFEAGARIGAAVVVNDGNPKAGADSIFGKVTPEVGVFTGVRF